MENSVLILKVLDMSFNKSDAHIKSGMSFDSLSCAEFAYLENQYLKSWLLQDFKS